MMLCFSLKKLLVFVFLQIISLIIYFYLTDDDEAEETTQDESVSAASTEIYSGVCRSTPCETVVKSETESKNETELKIETELKSETKLISETELKNKTEFKSETDLNSETKSKSETKLKSETELKNKTEVISQNINNKLDCSNIISMETSGVGLDTSSSELTNDSTVTANVSFGIENSESITSFSDLNDISSSYSNLNSKSTLDTSSEM